MIHSYMKVIKAGLSAAGEKGVKKISVPMIGAGTQGKKPEEMTRAIVRACCEFARTQVRDHIRSIVILVSKP